MILSSQKTHLKRGMLKQEEKDIETRVKSKTMGPKIVMSGLHWTFSLVSFCQKLFLWSFAFNNQSYLISKQILLKFAIRSWCLHMSWLAPLCIGRSRIVLRIISWFKWRFVRSVHFLEQPLKRSFVCARIYVRWALPLETGVVAENQSTTL